MSVHSQFAAASDAAEQALDLLDGVLSLLRKGHLMEARQWMVRIATSAKQPIAPSQPDSPYSVLHEMRNELAKVAGDVDAIDWHIGGLRNPVLSAHDAVVTIWDVMALWIMITAGDTPPELSAQFGIDLSAWHAKVQHNPSALLIWMDLNLPALHTNLIQERLKVLANPPPAGEIAALLPEFMSAVDLAKITGLSEAAVDSFLRRYRKKYADCFIETEGRRKGDPKFLYRTAEVLPTLRARAKSSPVTAD